MFSPLGNYHEHNHDVIREMLDHDITIPGASDGGAHCGLICDASFPTYLLTHWARDRTRGPKLSLERVRSGDLRRRRAHRRTPRRRPPFRSLTALYTTRSTTR